MKWNLQSPKYGDMIRIKTGNIYHYGIFVSDSEVIQFGLAPIARPGIPDCHIEVCISDIVTFSCGCDVEVGVCENDAEVSKRRSPQQTVNDARTHLGERGYNLIHNNCEHFAYLCATGEKYCSQTTNVRELFKNFPIVDVYVTFGTDNGTERALIEHALNRSFGKKPEAAALEHNGNAWYSSVCKIRVARHEGLIAVCVSRTDIELYLSHPYAEFITDSGVWQRKAVTRDIPYTVFVKTSTPQRVRFYNEINF